MKKQIGGDGEVAITSLTVYDPPLIDTVYEYNKAHKEYKPYSGASILKNITVDKKFKIILPNSTNQLSEANINTILSDKHTGFIIETNGDFLNKDIKPIMNYSGEKKHIIYIKFETQTSFFTDGKIMNTKYINTILNTNESFNNALKKILMGAPKPI